MAQREHVRFRSPRPGRPRPSRWRQRPPDRPVRRRPQRARRRQPAHARRAPMARYSSRCATPPCARARLSSIAALAVGLDDGGALLPVLEARARLVHRLAPCLDGPPRRLGSDLLAQLDPPVVWVGAGVADVLRCRSRGALRPGGQRRRGRGGLFSRPPVESCGAFSFQVVDSGPLFDELASRPTRPPAPSRGTRRSALCPRLATPVATILHYAARCSS